MALDYADAIKVLGVALIPIIGTVAVAAMRSKTDNRRELVDENSGVIARLREERDDNRGTIKEKTAENLALERDRDRGWDLARWWRAFFADTFASLRDYVHAMGNWMQVVLPLLDAAGIKYPPVPKPPPPVKLPGLEDPKI